MKTSGHFQDPEQTPRVRAFQVHRWAHGQHFVSKEKKTRTKKIWYYSSTSPGKSTGELSQQILLSTDQMTPSQGQGHRKWNEQVKVNGAYQGMEGMHIFA